jgi:hypothetical protein
MPWQPLAAGAAMAALDGLLGLFVPPATLPVWGAPSSGAVLRLLWGTSWPFAAARWWGATPRGRRVPHCWWAAAGG